MLDYKAANAGGELIKVDRRGTRSRRRGMRPAAAKTLADRRPRCDRGADLGRDVAAAMVVRHRAFGLMPGTGHGALSERVAASLASKAVAFRRRWFTIHSPDHGDSLAAI